MILPRFIALSTPGFIPNEAQQWVKLFDAGLGRLHVRKQGLAVKQMATVIKAVPAEYHSKMVLHGNAELLNDFSFAGYHGIGVERTGLKADQTLSLSAHSWQETGDNLKLADYVFLSPVFDSISKEGYLANPDLAEFPEQLKGKKIYALGGVNADNWEDAMDFGYHGVAVLGSLWENPGSIWQQFIQFRERGILTGWDE